MTRIQTAYASAYARDRVHVSRVTRGESRVLTANFNALMAPDDTITTVTWRAESGYPMVMSAAAIAGHTASVRVVANAGGRARMRCTATTSTGDVLTQLFRIDVMGAPYFTGEVIPASNGPTVLVTP
jgi:hypothetical protein